MGGFGFLGGFGFRGVFFSSPLTVVLEFLVESWVVALGLAALILVLSRLVVVLFAQMTHELF